MHTFQPYPIDMLDINPFTKLSKEWALVTAGDKEKSNTMTVSWGWNRCPLGQKCRIYFYQGIKIY